MYFPLAILLDTQPPNTNLGPTYVVKESQSRPCCETQKKRS